MPVHNGEKYLRKALESILQQTFHDFEVIAIDDGSTDNTLAILQEYASCDSRIRIVSREQRGLVSSLNDGIALARGKWIARMDADDIALPDRFEKQMVHLERTQADFCGGAVACFGKSSAVWRYPLVHEACEVHMLFDVPFAHPTVMGRAEAFNRLRYSVGFEHAEDYDLWQRAWSAGYRMANLQDVVLRYRVHSQQVSRQYKEQQVQTADHVRRRHWQALFPSMEIHEIDRILKAIATGRGKTQWIVPLLRNLVARYSGEAQQVIASNAFRVFCKMAGYDLHALFNWWYVTQSIFIVTSGRRIVQSLILLCISVLKATPDSAVYRVLRRLYS